MFICNTAWDAPWVAVQKEHSGEQFILTRPAAAGELAAAKDSDMYVEGTGHSTACKKVLSRSDHTLQSSDMGACILVPAGRCIQRDHRLCQMCIALGCICGYCFWPQSCYHHLSSRGSVSDDVDMLHFVQSLANKTRLHTSMHQRSSLYA